MIRPLSRTALILDIVGAALLFLVFVPMSIVFYGPGTGNSALGGAAVVAVVFAAVLMFGGVAIGRLAPGLALAAAWAGAILQMLAGFGPVPIDIAILLVLYATAAWGTRRVLWWGFGSALLGGLIAALYMVVVNGVAFGTSSGWEKVTTGTLLLVISVMALGFAWVCGLLWRVVLRARRTRAAQLQAESLAIEEQERVRIARDMHDIVAHSLAVVIAQADGARYAAAAKPEMATEALGTIAQTARGALSDVRMLLTQLRHRQGDGPQPTLADLEALFAQVRQAGIEPRVTVDPMPPGEPPGAIQLAVYRILQEALTNAIRHGDGAVDVHLAWLADRVDVDVRNTVSRDAAVGVGGHGVIGMRERAQLVGGSLQAERRGAQFVVHATLPIGAAE
ncbi:histidine kinase [Microbacterium sp. KSW4-16]|uniref:histidine kinase n=1 Tax=Microbacterium aurugineum TaxID=2851642 RepID=A0ABY4J4T7_9MICO|nr:MULTISPECIES: histidine kinase [Microbacterium]PKQ34344.1 MAG: two-component sensor histidine kinase [Actinobacteria bacterium HGW-Actinobacteria-11]MCK8466984.1 histidine kinase [Microbacterium aurugineum]MCZ4299873.1 histidine kinase [Microbacterium oxydans]QEA28632.1 two-component sensor histidine kinase [Microbacterium sp. CBA3102]TCJ28172.1 two-component sensor histidine kinase [Microbacterium sp. PI-1]